MSSPLDQTDIVARRVGPLQPPATAGERITGLAADNHFAGALLTLWHRVAQAGGAVGFEPSSTRTEVAAAVTEAVQGLRAGTWQAVALTAGNELIGVAFLVPAGVRIRRHLADVRALMVDPDRQRRGLGRRLINEIALLATEVGVSTLLLGARDGQRLDLFYEGLGFQKYGRLPDSVRLSDGSSYAEILYQRAAAYRP